MVKYSNKEIKMAGDILGESGIYSKNGFTGADLNTGATVVYRNVKRGKKPHGGSGAGSAEFAANDPRRTDIPGPARDTGEATPGAEPVLPEPVQVENLQVTSDNTVSVVDDMTDLRTILKVPPNYLSGQFDTVFSKYGGVLFPYSPQITIEHKAEYSSNTPLHSNYAINFYKSSGVNDITITGTFTVQNDEDAFYYLGAKRILSTLTKMRFGNDSLAGSPPPICRLYAYGEYILKNVPVVILSVKHDLPDDVDFYTTTIRTQRVSVPTKATITVMCKPTYSRKEMMNITVDDILSNSRVGRGYL
jgi:hypothetical protein